MNKLFGTDGIRGRAGEFPLDKRTVSVIGRALARIFASELRRTPRFVIGRDTRESGPLIENAFYSGAASGGAECVSTGVMTTPGIAFLTGAEHFDAGIVVSASHNPFEDNGIKIFMPDGRKLSAALESEIEREIESHDPTESILEGSEIPVRSGEFREDYIRHLLAGVSGLDLSGTTIVIDCANGAGSDIAPLVFGRTGAKVIAINAAPDGRNINKDCGSLHLDSLQKAVVDHRADCGVALDGDADRALFVDEKGSVVDGDGTLWIIASEMLARGGLINKKVIATLMSNIGLELAFREKGIELVRTAVGDKFVLEELLRTGSEIGGEQSGHIIFPKYSLVGDGILTALSLLSVLNARDALLSGLLEGFTAYPQILVNVRVREKRPFFEMKEIAAAAEEIEGELAGSGRLLLRYSGTENLARVMIEGSDANTIKEQANRLAGLIAGSLG